MNKVKFLLCLALLVSGVEGRGQIYINSYRFGAAEQLLLDEYPTAAAAFSLRKLRTDYTGDCIIVRRSSGSPALDTIGFVDNYLDTATLKTFCAGVNCFVRTWFDQSGNAQDVTQTTDGFQPQIISSGAFILTNNKPALQFDASDDVLSRSVVTFLNNISGFSAFAVADCNETAGAPPSTLLELTYASNNNARILFQNSRTTSKRYGLGGRRVSGDTFSYTEATVDDNNNQKIIIGIIDYANSDLDIYANTTNIATNTAFQADGNTDTADATFTIGGRFTGSANSFEGTIQEVVIYTSDKESDRTGISNNINTFYVIY